MPKSLALCHGPSMTEKSQGYEHYGWMLLGFSQREDVLLSDTPLGHAVRCVNAWEKLHLSIGELASPQDIIELQRHVFILQHVDMLEHYQDRKQKAVSAKELSTLLGLAVNVCSLELKWLLGHGFLILGGRGVSCSEQGGVLLYNIDHPLVRKLN